MKLYALVWITALSLICSLFVAELAVRQFHPAPKVFDFSLEGKGSSFQRSDNPVLGYTLKANVRNENANCHNNFPYTNAFGFRDVERTVERIDGVRRILLLGDSVVAGHGVCDLNKTISRRLEKALKGQAEVLNFGVGGYCTRGEVELLKEKGLAFNPDAVILLFVNNDYVNSNGSIIAALDHPPPTLARLLFLNSDLARWISLTFNLYGLRTNLDSRAAMAENQSAIGDNNIADGMALLHTLSQANNLKVLVALWPYFLDSGIREPTPTVRDDAREPLLIEQLAKQYGFEAVRLAPGFRQDFAKRQLEYRSRNSVASPRWFYTINDGTHPSDVGGRVAARILKEPVQKLLNIGDLKAAR